MVIASLTGVVEVMRKGLVPAVMANGRIVSLLREGQKLVFGDTEEVAWRLMVLGGFISLNTGYAHDLPADLRREIVAVIEHFVEWCEVTHERVTQQGVRDEEYTLYCQLDNELSALARGGGCVEGAGASEQRGGDARQRVYPATQRGGDGGAQRTHCGAGLRCGEAA